MGRDAIDRRGWIAGALAGVLVCALCRADLPATVTFNRDVAPLIFEKCAGCHHPGESAPFTLLTYDDVRRHAHQIVEVTQKGIMPPWLPKMGDGDFVGARHLSDGERLLIKRWVDAGTPLGEPAETPMPPAYVEGWQTGTPDLVLESPAYKLVTQGADVFRNFVVPIELEGPRWISSTELRPVNPRATHHARLGVDSSNESIRRDAEDPEPGYAGMAWGQDPDGQLVIWAPGMVASAGTPGAAWRLYPKTCLVLHTHMQPTGKPETVKFRIGIHFAKEPPAVHPVMMRIGSTNIDIPAGEKHHVVTDAYVLPIDVDVQTIFPHAHSLCREVRVVAEKPDGPKEPLLTIEHFDENWHDSYRYRKPVRLPKGTRLVSTFAYDNTDENIRNRNHPARRVVYGSNVTDEMADVYLQITPVHADQRAALMEHYKQYEMRSQIVGYGKSLEMYPDNPWSQEGLATCYVGLGQPARAIAILEQRLKTGPPAVYPVASLGMALAASGDFAAAEAQHRRAIAMDDQYPLAWFGLGKALMGQMKPEPAEAAFRRAVELAPGLTEAHISLADLLMKRGQLDEAANVCAAAVSDSPDLANVYLKLAEISARQGKYNQSLKHFESARAAAPYSHPPKVQLAVFCFANGQEATGMNFLTEARAESPEHPMPALILGQLASRQKQLATARGYLDAAKALPIPENWPESHRHRFLVLLHSERLRLAQQLNDEALARDAVAEWLKCDPENRKLREMSAELLGQAAPQTERIVGNP